MTAAETAELVRLTEAFFAMPMADKLAIEMVNSPHYRGYTPLGIETTQGEQDWREQIDIGPERPALPELRPVIEASRAKWNGSRRGWCRNGPRHWARTGMRSMPRSEPIRRLC